MHDHADHGLPAALYGAVAARGFLEDLRIAGRISRPGTRLWRGTAKLGTAWRPIIIKQIVSLRPEDEAERSAAARAEAEFKALASFRRTIPPVPSVVIPEPLACIPEHSAIVMEARSGVSLDAHVLRAARRLGGRGAWEGIARALRAAGTWLGVAQSRCRDRGVVDWDELAAYDEIRLGRLLDYGCLRSEFIDRIRAERARLRDQLASGGPQRAVMTHGDFWTGNLLLEGETVVILDFTMVGTGPAHQDLAYCFERLERYLSRLADRPFIRRRRIRQLQEALLEGYRDGAPISDASFRLSQLRHHLNYLVNLHEVSRGLRGILRRVDRRRGTQGLARWLDRRQVSPAGVWP